MGRQIILVVCLLVAAASDARTCVVFSSDIDAPATGPATEKRFPSLKVPDGFQATLFACDPLVEYPSVIAIGPQPGTLFVAHDYVTGLGYEIVKRDEIRLLTDTDEDGYADTSRLYADAFNSIQGLAHDAGTVYVMHAPLLTALRDTDGDGVSDERRDLLDGLGLPPEENSNRLHCANGVVAGHDGWLYLALGDRGCDVQRVEGDRLVFRAGGILRCRPDGRDLHVFATGMRNIYDIALDEELNVFVRDNENDGGDFMIRVCHSFYGADHGYPYLYRERPAEALRPLADLGRGSSAGGVAYLESAYPAEYRQSLFFCEWGRAVVRYGKRRDGASFESMTETDFAAGAPTDPYGFKPTDLVVDYDGSLLVSDWCDGQRPQRGRGRIYRISAVDAAVPQSTPVITATTSDQELLSLLGSTSQLQRNAAQREIESRILHADQSGQTLWAALLRSMTTPALTPLGRMHAVWIVAHVGGDASTKNLLPLAQTDADPRVRVQAVRALADLTDPVLVRHQLGAARGDEQMAQQIAGLAQDADPRVVLEVLVALGRMRWSGAPRWLARTWQGGDLVHAHAAMQLLRRSGNWLGVLEVLDRPSRAAPGTIDLRTIALQALGDQSESTIVAGILRRLAVETEPVRREQYIDLLARVYQRPAPWVYWGFRPEPRPANSVEWERTEQIAEALDRALADPNHSVRRMALGRMRREEIPIRFGALADWLKAEQDSAHIEAILQSLPSQPVEKTRPLLFDFIASPTRGENNRIAAFQLYQDGLKPEDEDQLLDLANAIEDGPVLAMVLESIGGRPMVEGDQLLLGKLDSEMPEVRAAALRAIGQRNVNEAARKTLALLSDTDLHVRRAAAKVAGTLNVRGAVDSLLKSAANADPLLCRASLNSLRQLQEPGAVSLAVAALKNGETQLAALNYLREFGTPTELDEVTKVAEANLSSETLVSVAGLLAAWMDDPRLDDHDLQRLRDALARIHGASGTPIIWSTMRTADSAEARAAVQRFTKAGADWTARIETDTRQRVTANGVDSIVTLPVDKTKGAKGDWLAVTEFSSATSLNAQFLASADGVYQVWLNGKPIFTGTKSGSLRPNNDRFEGLLLEGMNRLIVQVASDRSSAKFHIRFRPKSSKQEHERLTQNLLGGRGNVERGRELFFNAEKTQCIKCHRMGDTGGRIGPDLTGIGSRFSRIHLIESILEPSRTMAPSYATMLVVLDSGKTRTGVKIAETSETITLGDKDGKSHTIRRAEIEELRVDKLSVMPEGLERRMTARELTDLTAFLISQQKSPAN